MGRAFERSRNEYEGKREKKTWVSHGLAACCGKNEESVQEIEKSKFEQGHVCRDQGTAIAKIWDLFLIKMENM